MFETIKNAFGTKEIRVKIWATLLLLLVYRIGCFVPVPGLNVSVISQALEQSSAASFLNVISAITGGSLSQGTLFALGIIPFTFLFPLPGRAFGVKTRNYISSTTLMKLQPAMRVKYEEFMNEGSLIVLEGTVLDMMEVYDDLDKHIMDFEYDVRSFGFDPYNAKEFVARWETENGPFGIEKVIQGARTESVPLGELKKLAEERLLLFDEELMSFAMGNCITLEDTNGNRKLLKKRYDQKIDAVSAMMDAYVAYKVNKDAFE